MMICVKNGRDALILFRTNEALYSLFHIFICRCISLVHCLGVEWIQEYKTALFMRKKSKKEKIVKTNSNSFR